MTTEAGPKTAAAEKADRLPRGMSPPAVKLSDAITLVQRVNDMAGGSANYDTFSQITGNTKTSSSFQRKVAALRSFGLIEDRDNSVVLSDLGNRVVGPRDERDDLLALKEAMLRIDVLQRIYERHRGKLLPEETFLNNILVQELKVPKEVSRLWVEQFRDAIACAKLAFNRPDGKVQVSDEPLTNGPTTIREDERPTTSSTPPAPPPSYEVNDAMPIPLGKGRIARLILPEDWNAKKDLNRLLQMLKLSLTEEDVGAEQEEDE